jgi:hypothetical protein
MKKLVLCASIILFLIGCGGGQRASIEAIIDAYRVGSDYRKDISVQIYKYNGFKEIPIVVVNGESLWVDNYPSASIFLLQDSVPWVGLNSEVKIKVDYAEGTGEATDTLPEHFDIMSPTSGFILHKGNNLNTSWETANGAAWYWLHVDVDYTYIDFNQNFRDFEFDLDTIIHETSFNIEAARLFPSDVDTILMGSGWIDVEAVSGPEMTTGNEGNVKGSAVGFFWCNYWASGVSFGVEQLAGIPNEDHQAEIRRMHREKMLEFASEHE